MAYERRPSVKPKGITPTRALSKAALDVSPLYRREKQFVFDVRDFGRKDTARPIVLPEGTPKSEAESLRRAALIERAVLHMGHAAGMPEGPLNKLAATVSTAVRVGTDEKTVLTMAQASIIQSAK